MKDADIPDSCLSVYRVEKTRFRVLATRVLACVVFCCVGTMSPYALAQEYPIALYPPILEPAAGMSLDTSSDASTNKMQSVENNNATENTTEIPTENIETVTAVPPQQPMDTDNTPSEEEAEDISQEIVKTTGGQDIRYVERSEDSELYVELALKDEDIVLDNAMMVYQVGETILVPLSAFVNAFEFPITVDTARGSATGWFVSEDRTFVLESPYGSVSIGGKEQAVRFGIVETHLDDIYVSLDLLNLWFPMNISLNYNTLRLNVELKETLPFQAQAERRKLWEAREKNAQRQPGLGYGDPDVITMPYRMYTAPVIQVINNISHNVEGSTGGSTTVTGTSVNTQSDLLGMSARSSTNFTTSTAGREEIQSISINLSKESYEADLLGPLRATQFELGDVSTSSFALAGQQAGRGVTVTNEPYNFVRDANNFTIEGFGPVGWDVEVFQNNELLAFDEVRSDGRYFFDALPLSEGFNLFKIILYGPNGEVEERYDRYYLGQDMVKQGEFLYNMGALESSTPILDFSANPTPSTEPTLSLQGEFGLFDWLSVGAGYYHGPNGVNITDGIGFSARSSGRSTYMQANSFFDRSGGESYSLLLTGNVTDTLSWNAQHTSHIGYPVNYYTILHTTNLQLTKQFSFDTEYMRWIVVGQ